VVVDTRSEEVTANCLVRAVGTDHSVVGELNIEVSGHTGARRPEVDVRTERRATSVQLIGCTTANQPRPR
jgi:hypothetical protein